MTGACSVCSADRLASSPWRSPAAWRRRRGSLRRPRHPADDLRKIGNALPPDSSGLIVVLEDMDAEKAINELEGYKAEIVTFTIGDELSGEIDSYVSAEVTKTGTPVSEAGYTRRARVADPQPPQTPPRLLRQVRRPGRVQFSSKIEEESLWLRRSPSGNSTPQRGQM